MTSARPFSLLIKPASADCNLRCEYCFYLKKSGLYPDTPQHRMSDETLERLITNYMKTPQPIYSFGWQGGEPTLMGVRFFEKVIEIQKKSGKPGDVVSNGLQTNATLITDDFAKLLSEYHFLVGVSIDGPEDIHNHYRKTASSGGSHADVIRGVETLKRHNVDFNALVLVNKNNVGNPELIYDYLCDLGIYYHQYIPCVEFNDGKPLPFTITGGEWGNFLSRIFDRWIKKDIRRVSIREFDSIIGFLVDHRYSICTMGGRCNNYFVVEHNGDVYPCDFFVEKEKKLGNINTDTFDQLLSSKQYEIFSSLKHQWNSKCRSCDYLNFCSGDCLKHRFTNSQDPRSISWLCGGWKAFFEHSIPDFKKIAVDVLNTRQTSISSRNHKLLNRYPEYTPGRNEPCFCGSNLKYKKCHGAG